MDAISLAQKIMYSHTNTRQCSHTHIWCLHTHTHTHKHTHTHTYIYIYIYIYIYMKNIYLTLENAIMMFQEVSWGVIGSFVRTEEIDFWKLKGKKQNLKKKITIEIERIKEWRDRRKEIT